MVKNHFQRKSSKILELSDIYSANIMFTLVFIIIGFILNKNIKPLMKLKQILTLLSVIIFHDNFTRNWIILMSIITLISTTRIKYVFAN
jgi:hypothetical protein